MMPRLLGPEAIDPEAPCDGALVQDLELDRLLDAMAGGDQRVRAVARTMLLTPVPTIESVRRRQAAIDDAARHPDEIDALDALAVRAAARDRSDPLWLLSLHPTSTQRLSHAARRLERLLPLLDDLRAWCGTAGRALRSDAFTDLIRTIEVTLDDAEMERLRTVRTQLSAPSGVVFSASLDGVGTVADVRLRSPRRENHRLLGGVPLKRPHRTYLIPERDQAGFDAAAELVEAAVRHAADAASGAAAQLDRFLEALHDELGYLRAAERLRVRLQQLGVPLCAPEPEPVGTGFRATGLVDPCLALRMDAVPVANDVTVGADEVLLITGANRGGKSTLLRAYGVAQLMLRAGLPVAASSCSAALLGRIRSHWTRPEDEQLQHGKLDEELARMRAVVESVSPGDLLLSNESFASTNEREGSAIGLEVFGALAACGVRLAIVTHLFDLANGLADDPAVPTACLRAPREDDGARPFRLEPGPPLPTSFGADLFDGAFGTDLAARARRSTTIGITETEQDSS